MKKVFFLCLLAVFATSFVFASAYDDDLRTAVLAQDVGGVRSALSSNANPDYANGEFSVLMEACKTQNLAIIKLLLIEGNYRQDTANPSWKNSLGQTALMIAAKEVNNDAILRLLIERGANPNDVDFQNTSVLMYAMANANKSIALFMLKYASNLNQKDDNGDNAVFHAIRYNNSDVIKSISMKGGIDWSTTNNNGDNILSLAITVGRGNLDMLRTLCEIPDLDIDMKMRSGDSVLFWAIKKNQSVKVIEFLMEQYSPDILVEATDANGHGLDFYARTAKRERKKFFERKRKELRDMGYEM